MKSFKSLLSLFVVLQMTMLQLHSQETFDSSLVRIETTDGNEYIGIIVSQDADAIQLQTNTIGIVTIRKSLVASMYPVKKSEIRGRNTGSITLMPTPGIFSTPMGTAYLLVRDTTKTPGLC